ncbi:DUF4421 domain-containing protein [Parachryseolinea silvisoli]|uniref:DUF4421 domain-containing protein n=1 Tax=Parachryseolinea silvisoli TaxID=2873601 RepID=UPI002265D69E|nr:DUF4421 domain-containing protein [Parachryseolinea silvisoli]MCD9014272.1 DUF4421 domain-containing protein [Parachryseolinea silvisoli]
MKSLFRTLMLAVLALPAFAQDDVTIQPASQGSYDSVRSQYIQSFPDHFFLWPVLKQRRLDFEMGSLANKDYTLKYRSNKPYAFGLGMYIFELGIELAFSVPLDEQNKRIYGESDASDLQLNIIGKRWGIDAFVQKYRGFYIEDPNMNIPSNTPYPQRSDITTRNTGVSVNYTFNNKKFSFRSAYNFADRQLRSAGSFLLVASLSSFQASGDSAILGSAYAAEFKDDARIKRMQVTTLGLAPGYTYSIIYKGFFLNGTLAIGPAHNWLGSTLEGGKDRNDIRFNAYITARIGVGYNGDRFFGGMGFNSQNRSAKFDDVQLVSTSGTFKILIGYRFREFGILKKRISDLPKELTR